VFEKLRALRTELARETRVPPYVVFHDATLRELARALPRDEKSFLLVKGAGPSRWQRYGERVVAITGDVTPREAPPVRREAPPVVRDAPQVMREPEPQRDLRFPAPAPVAHERAVGAGYGAPAGLTPAGVELWTLCASGATLGDICTRLRRTAADVASELADGARQGKTVDVTRLLGPERVEAIRAAARGSNGDMVAVRRQLPFPAALAEIRLALTVA
jgi:ATP-dependent DNA helicase RecQ